MTLWVQILFCFFLWVQVKQVLFSLWQFIELFTSDIALFCMCVIPSGVLINA